MMQSQRNFVKVKILMIKQKGKYVKQQKKSENNS